MNPYSEKHKTLSNADLLKIIDNQADYRPLAIEAAKNELDSRQLSEEELAIAKAENEDLAQEQLVKNERKKAFENKVKDISSSFIGTIHPIQETPPSANRIITILSIVFGVLFLIEAFNQAGLIKYMLTDKNFRWSFGMIPFFLPLLFIPIATLLFWLRKKTGWILFGIFFTFSGVSAIALFLIELLHSNKNSRVDNLLPPASPTSFFWNLFFFGGCLWLICKKEIREIYAIDKRTMFITAGIGAILTMLTIWSAVG